MSESEENVLPESVSTDSLSGDGLTQGDAPQQKITPKKKRSALFRFFKYCFLFMVVILVWQMIDALPYRAALVSPETTLLTEPLTPDGKRIDYRRFLQDESPKVKTDENGFRLIVREIGPAFFFPDSSNEEQTSPIQSALRNNLCQSLGLDAKTPAVHPLQECYNAVVEFSLKKYPKDEQAQERQKLTDEFDQMGQNEGLWKVSSAELTEFMNEWTASISPALDTIAAAVQKEFFYVPVLFTSETEPVSRSVNNNHFMAIRGIIRSFRYRALWRIQKGNIDGAIADITAIRQLARHQLNRKNNLAVNAILAVALERYADIIPIASNDKAPLTAKQWESLNNGISSPSFYIDRADVLRTEQYLMLDGLQGVAWKEWANPRHETSVTEDGQGKKSTWDKIRATLVSVGLDWDIVMKESNRLYHLSENDFNTLASEYERFSALLTENSRSKLVAYNTVFGVMPGRLSLAGMIKNGQCTLNMTKIVYAMRRYEMEKGTLPPAFTVDAKGKPLHSWRVLLLPYLGQKELYSKIHLDEPWDSEYNKQFHSAVVPFYQCPGSISRKQIAFSSDNRNAGLVKEDRNGQTSYSVILGDNLLFDQSGKGRNVKEMAQKNPGQKVNHMILVVERADSVCWMKPDAEIMKKNALYTMNVRKYMFDDTGVFERDRSVPNLTKEGIKRVPECIASYHTGGANFGFYSGSVSFLQEKIDTVLFAEYVTGLPPQPLKESVK